MNGNDIFEALSGIDPKYIEEAAYELGSSDRQPDKVVNITSAKQKNKIRARKFYTIVLPSVAAILLIVGVALPAVLKVGKSESATMMESPAAGSYSYDESAAAPAAESTDEEAPASAAEEPANEAMAETAEAPAAAEAKETEGTSQASENVYDTQELKPDEQKKAQSEEPLPAVEPAEEAKAPEEIEPWEVKEADYKRDILVIRASRDITENIADMPYSLERLDDGAENVLVARGEKLSELSRVDVTDNWIVLDFIGKGLERGSYRLFIDDVNVDFEVK